MVGIVILDYNNAQDTINCLESIFNFSQHDDCKIIIVENGSNEDTIKVMKHYVSNYKDSLILDESDKSSRCLPYLTLLCSQTNDGYAAGNNKALRLFDIDEEIKHILILNNDILFIDNIISPLVKYSESLPNCGIISCLLLKKDGKSIDYCCARKDFTKMEIFYQYLFAFVNIGGLLIRRSTKRSILKMQPELMNSEFFEIELPSGSCMLIKKDIFHKVNYFDDNTFLYFEENILYRKMKQHNYKNYLIPSLKCIHLGASTSKKSPSTFIMKCQMESTAYYLANYRMAPFLATFVKIMSHLTLLKIKLQHTLRSVVKSIK